MDLLSQQCAAQSVGTANQIFGLVFQALLTAQCAISPEEMWPKDYGPTAENGLAPYDFTVIGGGSAGSVVASRLSENPKWNVLLLEAGGDPPIESEVPAFRRSLFKTKYDWQFTANSAHGCTAYKNGCEWTRGKMLGGCSSINAMMYLRAHRRDYDQWQAFGNPGWGYDNVLEYFKKSENNTDDKIAEYQNGKYHNQSGLLKVGSYRANNPFESKTEDCFVAAGDEAGYPYIDDFNSDKVLGYSRIQGTINNGRRQNVATAFLIPAKNRPNLHVIKNAHATKIHFDSENRATAVDFIYNGDVNMTAIATKEIIVSAGALSGPQLLMLSGIGPKKHLQEMGINVVQDLSVGQNLQDHLVVPLFFSLDPALNNPENDITTDAVNLLMNNRGPLTSIGITDLIGFINTVNGSGYPDIQLYHFEYAIKSNNLKMFASSLSEEIQAKLTQENQQRPLAMVFVTLLNPKSRGYIKLKSTNPLEKPLIVANYFNDDDDWKTTVNGVKYQYNQTQAKSFKKYNAQFVELPLPACAGLKVPSDEYFKRYIDALTTTIFHPVGTCKMGPVIDRNAVVDSRLRVHGVNNLRVIDASIMPKIVSANTNAPTIMIGEMGADFIKADWRLKDVPRPFWRL